ncbi:deoxyribose-phosphate aldolase [candidate division WOR-3 bacterium]|nr:deoxyribose-phosphate aldolase [candidate division WOR-3 bacterium]
MIFKKEIDEIKDNFKAKKPPEIKLDSDLRSLIEHTCLSSDVSDEIVLKTAEEALKFSFFGICIPPSRVKFAKELTQGSGIKIVTVISFPMGYSTAVVKASEAAYARDCGADEVDLVIDIGSVLEGNYARTQKEVRAVVSAVGEKTPVKAIIETALLDQDQIITSAFAAAESGAKFIKTSTGFSKRGASVADIMLLKSASEFFDTIYGIHVGIKASGGIKDRVFALNLVAAGADRIGSSKSLSLI